MMSMWAIQRRVHFQVLILVQETISLDYKRNKHVTRMDDKPFTLRFCVKENFQGIVASTLIAWKLQHCFADQSSLDKWHPCMRSQPHAMHLQKRLPLPQYHSPTWHGTISQDKALCWKSEYPNVRASLSLPLLQRGTIYRAQFLGGNEPKFQYFHRQFSCCSYPLKLVEYL